MKVFKKALAVFLAVLMVLAVTPLTFAAVDTSTIAVGDVVAFGNYEQDNDGATTDPVEWIVIGKDGDVLKLITKYIINTNTPFAKKRSSKALWGSENKIYAEFVPAFVAAAFTAKEKAAIVPVDNGAIDHLNADLGDDLVYLPSIEDVTTGFATDEARIASNTAVAAKTSNATPVGQGAKYFLRDETYKDEKRPLYYANYVDVDGSVHVASADDLVAPAEKSQKVGIRLVTNVDISRLFTTGKNEETGVTPLLGTLGTYKVVWQCKCVDAEGNEKIHTFTFLDSKNNPISYQMVDHGESATPPDQNDVIIHKSNFHQGYEFVGWDQDYSSVTSEMTLTAVYEEIPEDSFLIKILKWIRSILILLLSIIETEVLPVIREWLDANLGLTIPW